MFIVFDSIDGAGKGRQREEITRYIQDELQKEVHTQEFPVHNVFYESIIHPALQGETSMNKASWVLSYLLDKTLEAEKIRPFVSNPENLMIVDGYFTTTIAYQSFLMGQVEYEKLLQYSVDFEIPKPDLAVFIDADPETAIKRKEVEEGHDEGLDMFEKSLEKQKRLQGIYKKMAAEQLYCPWETVDGNGSIEEVKESILQVLKSKQLI